MRQVLYWRFTSIVSHSQGLVDSATPLRDAETNPYYDPGWAQSVRRDSPKLSSSYVDRRRGYYNSYTGIESVASSGAGTPPVTYPGMADPRRTDKVYTNPTNP